MTIQAILSSALEERCQRNVKYSLRAFARDLKISPQSLSHIMNGRRGISLKTGSALAKQLGFDTEQTKLFLNLVDVEFARSSVRKRAAQKKVLDSKAVLTSSEESQVLSGWYHLALLTLLQTKPKSYEPRFLAKRLGITLHEAKSSLDRLLRLGMIHEDRAGRMTVKQDYFINPSGTSNEAVKRFHEQMLEQTRKAIFCQTTEERDLFTIFLPVDPAQVSEIREEIRKFSSFIETKYSNSKTNKKEVYALGLQYIRIGEKEETT